MFRRFYHKIKMVIHKSVKDSFKETRPPTIPVHNSKAVKRLHYGKVPLIEYFSANPPGQDRWVIEQVFPKLSIPGYFVEAGAADGIKASNTYALELYKGWTGILCEPNSTFFKKLRVNRNCIVENVYLADTKGKVEFIEASWFSTARKVGERLYGKNIMTHERFQEDVDGTPVKLSKKRAVTLASLLEKWKAPSTIHYLSLDVEGAEYDVLKNFPYSKYTFLCMTIEAGSEPLRSLLISKGYKLVNSVYGDDFWIHSTLNP